MGMGVEIFNRKSFHLLKQIVPDIAERTLSDIDQYPGLGKGCHHADGIKYSHSENCRCQGIELRILLSDQRQDIIVNQRPHEHGSLKAAVYGCKDTDDYNHPSNCVIFQCIIHHTFKKHARIFYLWSGSPSPGAARSMSARSLICFLVLIFRHMKPPAFLNPASSPHHDTLIGEGFSLCIICMVYGCNLQDILPF